MKDKILLATFAALAAVACTRDIAPDASLGVKLPEGQYKAGEPVTFRFEGDPDNIVFYSGENGHRYENRRRTEGDCDVFLDFKTLVRANGAGVYDNLRVLVSTDFNGVYDKQAVEAATWTDLTEHFRLSNGTDNYPSGQLKLNDYVGKGNFFLAFRYIGKGNQWIVRTADLVKVSPEGVGTSLGTMSTMGWNAVDCANEGSGVDKTNFTRLYFDGNKAGDDQDNDDWIISAPMDSKGLEPDTGVALKSLSDVMSEYSYVYTEPGIYKAVFETSSVWYDDSKWSVTEVEVTVVGEGGEESEPAPVLTVTSDKAEYIVGEEAVFTLSGEGVSNITFWAGDEGHDWEQRNNYDRYAKGNLTTRFTTRLDYMSGESPATDNLHFLISKDFSGVYDAGSIAAANWIDLSSACTFAKEGEDNISSGELSVNDWLDGDEDVFFALKYENESTWKNRWVVRAITVDAITPSGVKNNVAKMTTMDWQYVNVSGKAVWGGSGQLLINPALGDANEDWAISKSFERGSMKIGPDTGESLSGTGTKTYTFKAAGSYTVVVDYFDGKQWRQANCSVTVKEA